MCLGILVTRLLVPQHICASAVLFSALESVAPSPTPATHAPSQPLTMHARDLAGAPEILRMPLQPFAGSQSREEPAAESGRAAAAGREEGSSSREELQYGQGAAAHLTIIDDMGGWRRLSGAGESAEVCRDT